MPCVQLKAEAEGLLSARVGGMEGEEVPRTAATLVASTIGGAIIGVSAALFLLLSGQRAGLSGIFSGFLNASYKPWKSCFVGGFLATSWAASRFYPSLLQQAKGPQLGWTANIIAGVLVGFGTRLGNGCTSGHGVCGLARLSKRGLASVLTFMAVGAATCTAISYRGAFREAASAQWDEPWASSKQDLGSVVLGVGDAWAVVLLGLVSLLLVWDVKGKKAEGWGLSLAALVCGALFAVGLIVGGMSIRQKLLNFLYLAPSHWDPSLLGVMGGAVLVNLGPTQYLMNTPGTVALCDAKTPIAVVGKSSWDISKAEKVDWQLITGAILFGLGWGLGGLCPGPAWVVWAAGYPKIVIAYLPAMIAGTVLHAYVQANFLTTGGTKKAK